MKLRGISGRHCKRCGVPMTEARTDYSDEKYGSSYCPGDVIATCPPPPMKMKCTSCNNYKIDVYPIVKNHIWTGKVVNLNRNSVWVHDFVKFMVEDMLEENRIDVQKLDQIQAIDHRIGELGRFVSDLCEEILLLKEKTK